MKSKDLVKLKVSFPHKRKAQDAMIASKKARIIGASSKSVPAEQSSAIEVILATTA